MRHVIHKVFTSWNYDKEELWLNEMAAKGFNLVSVGFCRYVFEDGNPGKYKIRIELLEQYPSEAESIRYISFLEETGVEYIGNVIRWVYFRKKASDSDFDLFSDLDSRIKHLRKVIALLQPACIIDIVVGVFNVSLYAERAIHESRLYVNLFSGSLCLAVGLWLVYGLIKIRKKRKELIKERALHE